MDLTQQSPDFQAGHAQGKADLQAAILAVLKPQSLSPGESQACITCIEAAIREGIKYLASHGL